MIDKTLLYGGWAVAIFAASQLAPVSWLAINPQKVEIKGHQVSAYRSFPGDLIGLPRPRISYVETIKPISQGHNGGHPCIDKGGPFRYVRPEPVGRWSIEWASDCTNDPVGYHWSAEWTWHMGAVKFGPVWLSETILAD